MTVKTDKKLFTPFQIGAISLKHRVVLPPMSRLRGHWPSAVPSDLMFTYYTQRASDGGLIMTEANATSPEARAYHTGPGLYSDDQVAAWRRIVDAVHAKGCVFFAQLTHAGRATHESVAGKQPATASVNPQYWADKSVVVSAPEGFILPAPHRALDVEEIKSVVAQFRVAAENAKRAGFDGIEILAGNAHLVEQFLHDSSNQRTDAYGGSIENRARLLFEILDEVSGVYGPGRVGVRISPSSVFAGMGTSDPRELYRHVAQRLNDRGYAYLHVIEPRISGADTVNEGEPPVASAELREIFKGPLIGAGGFDPGSAEAAVRDGVADLVAIGRFFSSNPDLPHRIRHDLPLTPYDRNTFYAFDAKGYTDFPTYEASKQAGKAA
jgi:N-ethylmaleimide reductase